MHQRTAVLALTVLVLCTCSGGRAESKGKPAAPIRVLFLGDQGHHKPAERAAQLLPYLSGRGIDARYSEDQNDLSAKTLADADVVLIYANDESITPEQE